MGGPFGPPTVPVVSEVEIYTRVGLEHLEGQFHTEMVKHFGCADHSTPEQWDGHIP